MRVLSAAEKQGKLRKLAETEGHSSVLDLLEAAALDSVSPAICTEPDCNYTTEIEPDQDAGYCEACGHQSVASAMILARLI